jgi:hypothetical protein
LSATLTQNREEHYFSQGRIINGVLRPDIFVKFRKSNHVTKISLFNFNHKKKKIHVTKSKIKKVYSTRYDIHTMKNIDVTEVKFDISDKDFRLYTQNDLLSLFFNTQKILPTLKKGERKQYTAVGSKMDDCIIDIAVPHQELKEELEIIMPKNIGRFITIIIHQDIFQSQNGELHVNFDENGFAQDVVLKDVLFFGDIRGKRTNQTSNSTEDFTTIQL